MTSVFSNSAVIEIDNSAFNEPSGHLADEGNMATSVFTNSAVIEIDNSASNEPSGHLELETC